MNNERIDLTQFEGVPKGPWRWKETADYGSIKPWNMPRDLVNDEGELIIEANLDVSMEEVDDLLAKAPDLLAELKRMYEREDALVSAIKELCDSEDSTGCSGDLTVVSLDPMLKLYELTSE